MTDVDPNTLDALAADLRSAVGKDKAITSGELAARHVPDDSEANPKTRELVKDVLMRERNLPIVSCSNGYYIPTDQATIDAELESLRGRQAAIEERMQLLVDNWQAWDHGITDVGELSHRQSDDGPQSCLDSAVPGFSLDELRNLKAEMDADTFAQIRADSTLQLADFKGETNE